ncbi:MULTISPECIES: Arc family DNA-binding protein [Burkholderia]|uniref:Arc family DNA-binding protein n=1 Tax=Burkholderia TaxID=32008 RepID=UPI000D0075E5|nr:Arc family DNA-binding protein [Burkholderia gladioli]PRG49694.1 hypothetical protein C6V06_23535 [Burkholderia gladioli]
MARTDPQVNIRMPASLKERLEQASSESKRSLNSEIVERLEGSLDNVVLPLTDELRHELTSSASMLGRSLESEIVERLVRGTDAGDMHRVISQLSSALEEGNKRRKKENTAIHQNFKRAIEDFSEKIEEAARKGVDDEILDSLRNVLSEHESMMYQLESLIDFDADYLSDM